MCSSSHSSSGASDSDRGRGIAFAYCAWPPVRCGGLISTRETSFAYDCPWSWPSTYRQRSAEASMPPDDRICPSSTYIACSTSRALGKAARNSSASAQCVVTRRPSSTPAWPSTKAPAHSDTSRAPSLAASAIASRTAGSCGFHGASSPGTMTVSAPLIHSIGFRSEMAKPSEVGVTCLPADADLVRRLGLVADLGEHRRPSAECLHGDGQIEDERAPEHDHRDAMARQRLPPWPNTWEGWPSA